MKTENLRRYWMAFAITAIFMLGGRLLYAWFSYNPILFGIINIVTVSWLYGRGPGVFASVCMVFMVRPLFFPKLPVFDFEGQDFLRLLMYLGLTGFVSHLVGLRRAAEVRLLVANADLDRRVQERTAELAEANAELRRINQVLEEERERVIATNEALQRANRDLEHFAYSASHDLQEPIRNVAIFSEIVGSRYQHLLDESGQTYLQFIREGAERMGTLVRGLLDYTTVANAAADLTPVCDANRALDKALENLSGVIHEARATVRCDELPDRVAAHEVHLQQVLQNLIGNALKYRGGRAAVVEVGAQRAGDAWRFRVRDYGIGIPPEYQEFIFGLFKRLHGNAQYSGTGLGLPICRRIIEQYGGSIWVESDGQTGSAFYFTLPAAEGSRSEGTAPQVEAQAHAQL